MSRSIAQLAKKALAHREMLREQGQWQPFLEGKDLRHITVPPQSTKARGKGKGRGKGQCKVQEQQVMDQEPDQDMDMDSSEEQETV